MILLILIPILAGIIIPILLAKKGRIELLTDHSFGWDVLVILLCLLLTAVSIAFCQAPIGTGRQVAENTAFYETNQLNYGITVDETASYLSQESFEAKLIAGSVEKLGLGEEVAHRVLEWRDKINEYNLWLAKYKYYSTHLALSVLYVDCPEDLKPLIIGNP